MKSFVILVGVLLIAVVGINGSRHPPPPINEEMKKNFDECREELGITVEEKRELHTNDDFINEKMRCMPACLMKKDGFLEEGNKLNIKKMVEAVSENFEAEPVRAKEIIEECAEKAQDKEEECDFAKTVKKCLHKKMRREFNHGPPHRGPHGPMTEEMKKNFEECREELGMTVEEERELHRKHDSNNKKLRCFPACLMKKDGFLEAGNKINIEKIFEIKRERHAHHNQEVTQDNIEKCAKNAEEKEDECDVAQSFHQCIHEKMRHVHKHSEELEDE